MRILYLTVSAALIGCGSVPAQSPLAERILGVRDGTVRLAYSVHEGTCGDGATFIRDRSRGEDNYVSFDDGNSTWRGRTGSWRYATCEPGPARVAITKQDSAVTRVRVYVGGEWGQGGSGITDLGTVAAPAAAKALVTLAGRERRADEAIFAAMIADSAVIWPDLLAIAKSTSAPTGNRKNAVFWLSQIAGDAATKGLTEIAENEDGDREVRDQAVFALSQLPADQGVPVLIRLARTNRDPKVRRKALFWLGQSDDPRALQLIEEILTRG